LDSTKCRLVASLSIRPSLRPPTTDHMPPKTPKDTLYAVRIELRHQLLVPYVDQLVRRSCLFGGGNQTARAIRNPVRAPPTSVHDGDGLMKQAANRRRPVGRILVMYGRRSDPRPSIAGRRHVRTYSRRQAATAGPRIYIYTYIYIYIGSTVGQISLDLPRV